MSKFARHWWWDKSCGENFAPIGLEWTAAGNMEVSRGKAAGFYNNQQIHLHKHENLSQEELDAKVVEALKHYQPIIDKNAEVVTDELSSLPTVEESSSDLQK